MKLAKGEREKIKDRMDTLMERRKDKQPLEYPSAGSTFKRPEGDFAARLIAVSYTHLDVYKRQGQHCTQTFEKTLRNFPRP